MPQTASNQNRGDAKTAEFLQQYADFLECHIDPWTVTTEGTVLPDVPRHFIRIQPIAVDDAEPDENPNRKALFIKNRAPGQRTEFPAKEIVDAGFLELVRYGIRKAGDPLIEDSLRVVDAVLKVETPLGPCWRRYNHDGYGQREDGGPFNGWGRGRDFTVVVQLTTTTDIGELHETEPSQHQVPTSTDTPRRLALTSSTNGRCPLIGRE